MESLYKNKGSLTEVVTDIFMRKATEEEKEDFIKRALKLANDVADGRPDKELADDILDMAIGYVVVEKSGTTVER